MGYVLELERARTFAELYYDGVQTVSTDCDVFPLRETTRGYVLLTGCGGHASGNRDNDRIGQPSFYYVDPERTVRTESFTGGAGGTGVYLLNFRRDPAEVTVEIVPQGEGSTAKGSFHLDGPGGGVVRDAVGGPGEYELRVRTNSASTAFQWALADSETGPYTARPPVVTVAPETGPSVDTAPIGKVLDLGPF